MQNITDVIKRMATYTSDFEKNKNVNDARKVAEAICRVILLGIGTSDAKEKAEDTELNKLIDSLTVRRLTINESHLKKIKDDLRHIQTYGNISSHDNSQIVSPDEINRVGGALNNLLKNVFNSKDQIYIRLVAPE